MPLDVRFDVSDFTEFDGNDDGPLGRLHPPEAKIGIDSSQDYADLPTTTVSEDLPTVERQRRKAVRRENLLQIINALDPSVINCCSTLLKTLMDKLHHQLLTKHENNKPRQPMECFAMQQCYLTAFLIHRKLLRKSLSYLHIREYFENLGSLCEEYVTRYGFIYGNCVSCNLRSMILSMEQLAGHLERCSGVQRTDWIEVARMYSSESFSPLPKDESTSTLGVKLFTPVKLIGAGNFGSTYVATVGFQTDVRVMLKLVNIFSVHDASYLIASKVFAAMVNSPWIRPQYCAFSTSEAHVFASAPFQGISLYRVVKNCGRFGDAATLRIILAQLAMAIQHMHIQGFLHRNIKPSSMLVNQKGRLVVGEFDMCKICLGRFTRYKLRVFDRGTVGEFSDRTRVGSISYMAPEMLLSQPYGRSSDWWSFGITAYAIFVGKIPFSAKGYKAQKEAIIEGKYEFPKNINCPNHINSLISRLLRVKPHERLCSLNYREIWQLKIFQGLDLESLQTTEELLDLSTINDIDPCNIQGDASVKFDDLTDNRDDDNVLTFASPGFIRVISKINANQPYCENDFKEPMNHFVQETSYMYKYNDKVVEESDSSRPTRKVRVSVTDTSSASSFEPFLGAKKKNLGKHLGIKQESSKMAMRQRRKNLPKIKPFQESGKYTDRIVKSVNEVETAEPPSLEAGYHLMESQLTNSGSLRMRPKRSVSSTTVDRHSKNAKDVEMKKKKRVRKRKWYNVFFGRP